MRWKQWTAVAVVIGGGILLQIPGHNNIEMDHGAMDRDATESDARAEMEGPYRTVALDVTGMT